MNNIVEGIDKPIERKVGKYTRAYDSQLRKKQALEKEYRISK